MYFTGFADEAAKDLPGQIAVTKELGWSHIESRNIDGTNIHNLSDADFERVYEQLAEAKVQVSCFGSAIANWQKQIDQPFETSLAETQRAIPRMRRLGTKLVRIMSFAVRKDSEGSVLAEQMEQERFRRVRELLRLFTEAGLTPVHENCMNYGGMGWTYTQRLIENVPGLKLVFDTGNPTMTIDYSATSGPAGTRPMQSTWEFYRQVREHIAYIHIKDGKIGSDGKHIHTFAGEGAGDVERVLTDLLGRGYDGGISIEPHIAAVFHDPTITSAEEKMRTSYLAYGRRVMHLVAKIRRP
jgi:sugar phosphate isomerase/epimerase